MKPSQPNKPVMDVAPAAQQGTSVHPVSEPVPEIHDSPAQTQSDIDKQKVPEQEKPSAERAMEGQETSQQDTQKPKSTLPVGVITTAVLVMLVLIGLAVAVYLTS